MSTRPLLVAWLVGVCVLVPGRLRPHAQIEAGARAEAPAQAPNETGIVRVTPEEAALAASEARSSATVEVPDGLALTLWASERLLVDPVAIDIDARGTVYLTSTTRNNLPLDIRGHRDWMTTAHTLRTTGDLRAFYREQMAPERSAANTWITDLNQDGSRDIRDLEEMTERVYRLQDTDGDGFADLSQVMIEGFNQDPVSDIAGGVLYLDGDLIVGVPPGVYRLRDVNGDGTIDQQTTISEGYYTHPTFGGHGISGVTMGPDGRLYWEVGDMGLHVVDGTGRAWAYPNQGAVLRSEVDGSNFEVFATGIRNLQEFSFDEHGNLISVDNDGDYAGETERLVYLPYGSDSGWRSNWQYGKYTDPRNNRYNVWMDEEMFRPRHYEQTAHILPPIAPWHAGPSGMAYNPGTALSERWRRHFFVSSFPGSAANARIYGFTLEEDGAGFAMGDESLLLRGILTVGMRIGPDGALYLTDWVTGWDSKDRGRLWKVDAPAEAASPVRREVQALLAEDFAVRDPGALAPLLRHADMRVRQKAQFELARRGEIQALLGAVRDPRHELARLHGLWGVGQLARQDERHASHLVGFLTDPADEVRAQAARMIGDVRYAPAGDLLLPLLYDPAPRVRFFAAEALGRMAHAPAVAALVDMLAHNDGRDVYLQHAGSLALASIGDAAALEALATHASRGVRVAAVMALRRLKHPAIVRFLADADEQIVTDAARGINDDGSIPAAVPALAALLGQTPFANEPLLRRVINANLRVGTPEAAERLAAFAGDASQPEALRVEAIAALGVWAAPSPLDRVDGFYLDQFRVPPPVDQTPVREGQQPRELPHVQQSGEAQPIPEIQQGQEALQGDEPTQAAPAR